MAAPKKKPEQVSEERYGPALRLSKRLDEALIAHIKAEPMTPVEVFGVIELFKIKLQEQSQVQMEKLLAEDSSKKPPGIG